MKIVCTELKGSTLMHTEEQPYLPADAELSISYFDKDGDNTKFYEDISDADIILNSYVYFGKKELDAMKKCKVISFQSTGYNAVDLEYSAKCGIAVTSIVDYCTQETAENAISTMMALQRHILEYNDMVQKQGIWNAHALKGIFKRVEGQTMSIIGLGRIGRHVAKIAGQGLGMKILAYDPFIPQELADSVGATLVDFDTALAEGDVISIHMNLTPENVHMFNKDAFRKMKKQPIIINEGRGEMISEADLIWALDEGLVRGAGLDMLELEYPTPEYIANSPLMGRPNVIICPHSGHKSETSMALTYQISVENAIACYEGRYKDAETVRNGVGV